jgi:hypothetical protein
MKSITVYYDPAKFAGFPANAGLFYWENEILAAFHIGEYLDKPTGHRIDEERPMIIGLARSLDGGETWQVELDNPINRINTEPPIPLPPEGIDFSHPGFALKVGKAAVTILNSTFVVSYDRGHTWEGPYLLPDADGTLTPRTDYIVESESTCLLMMSRRMKGIPCRRFPDRAYAVRLEDRGRRWKFLGYVADKQARSVLTNTVRMSDGRLICACSRRRDPNREEKATEKRQRIYPLNNWIEVQESRDGGINWTPLSRLTTPYDAISQKGNPPALSRLPDGRLVIVYAFRGDNPRLVARLSADGGQNWGEEVVLDSDTISDDLGYPKTAMLPFGRMVVVYFIATREQPQQHIKALIWTPGEEQA